MKITNQHNVPLPLAVWLLHDEYQGAQHEKQLSATTLLKSVKANVLIRKAKQENKFKDVEMDLMERASSRMGSALHQDFENAWTSDRLPLYLKQLGYDDDTIQNVVINPQPHQLTTNALPVYLEQRIIKPVDHPALVGYEISGQFDLVIDGTLGDLKSTSTYTYINDTNRESYILQGSIYRWLNPDIITNDEMVIYFYFTDHMAHRATENNDYPPHKVAYRTYPLMSLEATEQWILDRLTAIEKGMNASQDQLPFCTPAELWQSPPMHKYYKNPSSKRATKRSENLNELMVLKQRDGNVGIIKTFPAEVRRCKYCLARPFCHQATMLEDDGLLAKE